MFKMCNVYALYNHNKDAWIWEQYKQETSKYNAYILLSNANIAIADINCMTFLNSKLQIQTLNNVTLCLKMTVLFVNLQCSILPKNPKVSSKATALAMKSLKYFQDVRILWQSGDTQNSHIVCLGRPKQGMKYKYYAKYAIHHFPLLITFD